MRLNAADTAGHNRKRILSAPLLAGALPGACETRLQPMARSLFTQPVPGFFPVHRSLVLYARGEKKSIPRSHGPRLNKYDAGKTAYDRLRPLVMMNTHSTSSSSTGAAMNGATKMASMRMASAVMRTFRRSFSFSILRPRTSSRWVLMP